MTDFCEEQVHAGHRSRMKAKLEKHGRDIFDTYELLEMLLYFSIPYKDTNPVAKRLLARFGSLDGVLSASRDELVTVDGIGERTADFLVGVDEMISLLGVENRSDSSSVFDDYVAAGEYLVEQFRGLDHPRVMILMFDNRMRLIDKATVCDLDYDRGSVRAKDFIDPALRNRAAVVITAHNHPYGPFVPTPGDRETNALITDAFQALGIEHLEHYLVSGDNFIGISRNFRARLSQTVEIADFLDSKNRRLLSDGVEENGTLLLGEDNDG